MKGQISFLLLPFFLIFSFILSGQNLSVQKHSIYASFLEIDSNGDSYNYYGTIGMGYEYLISNKFGVIIQGHRKYGRIGRIHDDSHSGGNLKEWNFKLGVQRRFEIFKKMNFLSQLSIFREKYWVENGEFTFRETIPWKYSGKWTGFELNLGPEFIIHKSISIFSLSALQIGKGTFRDSISFNALNGPIWGRKFLVLNELGIRYFF